MSSLKTQLRLVSWNVRSLLDSGNLPHRKTALLARELARYNIDIAALSETRFSEEGSLVEERRGTLSSGRATPPAYLDSMVWALPSKLPLIRSCQLIQWQLVKEL